jgi:hypothetical protein
MRRCARCGEEKPTSEFNWKNEAKGWLASYCKPCVREHSREHYIANKRSYIERTRRRKRQERANRAHLIVQYLESHPCVDCGETDPLVLEFDHRGGKEFTIGREFTSRPWEDVLAEIDKCDVRCANCHRRRTAERGGFLRLVLSEAR